MEYIRTTRKSRREQEKHNVLWVSCSLYKDDEGVLRKRKVRGTKVLSNRELLSKLSKGKRREKQKRKLMKCHRRLMASGAL